jgi:hypothetical protein
MVLFSHRNDYVINRAFSSAQRASVPWSTRGLGAPASPSRTRVEVAIGATECARLYRWPLSFNSVSRQPLRQPSAFESHPPHPVVLEANR